MSSPAGNRTPVSRVTGGDTDHYTTEDLKKVCKLSNISTVNTSYTVHISTENSNEKTFNTLLSWKMPSV